MKAKWSTEDNQQKMAKNMTASTQQTQKKNCQVAYQECKHLMQPTQEVDQQSRKAI